MRKKVVSLVLAGILAMSALAGCGSNAASDASSAPKADTAATTTDSSADSSASTDAAGASSGELLTIDFYDVAANYQGIQSGWYGKIVKDKFNIELNIIAPQVSGDGAALYQTRCADGNLGDVIILDNSDMMECVDV